MKYICLGHMNDDVWETMSERERNRFMDECFAYDEELKKKGHYTVRPWGWQLGDPPRR